MEVIKMFLFFQARYRTKGKKERKNGEMFSDPHILTWETSVRVLTLEEIVLVSRTTRRELVVSLLTCIRMI